jgi:hypothetical protein
MALDNEVIITKAEALSIDNMRAHSLRARSHTSKQLTKSVDKTVSNV